MKIDKKIDNGAGKHNFRLNRRTFVKIAGVAIGTMAFGLRIPFTDMARAASLTKFADPLIIPPVAVPGKNSNYPGADYYELSITKNSHSFHSSLPATNTYGIGGVPYLAPTIIAKKDKKVVVKFINNLPLGPHLLTNAIDPTIDGSGPTLGTTWTDENRIAIHLHGGKTKPEADGHPRRWFSPMGSSQANPYPESPGTIGFYIYEYSNEQPPSFLWYHDHAWGITRFNPLCGIAGAYLLRDNDENALLSGKSDENDKRKNRESKIPSGKYDIPVVLQDKFLDPITGAILYPDVGVTSFHPKWIPEYFGDNCIVNGTVNPYVDVEARRYRLHIVNGANARFFNLYFDKNIPFWIIGSDQGFLPSPVARNNILMAPGERFDAIVDFTGMAGTSAILQNNADAPYPDGDPSNALPDVMEFRIKPLVGVDTTTLPSKLKLPSIATISIPPKPWKEIVLRENEDPLTGNPIEVLLDSKKFMDTLTSPLITEKPGQIDVWQFVNLTPDAHPMHVHLVRFKILNRQPINVDAMKPVWDAWIAGGRVGSRPSVDNYLNGDVRRPDPEENGWKDTAKAYPGEVLRIISKFDLPKGTKSGRYVSHCHILEHEENDMMFNFEVKL